MHETDEFLTKLHQILFKACVPKISRPADQVADDHSYSVHSAAPKATPARTRVAASDSPEPQDGRSTQAYARIPTISYDKRPGQRLCVTVYQYIVLLKSRQQFQPELNRVRRDEEKDH